MSSLPPLFIPNYKSSYSPLEYSAVSTNSAPSEPQQVPEFVTPDTHHSISLVCKPSKLYKHIKEGYVKVISEINVGKHGCKRYNLNVYETSKYKPPFNELTKIECKPLTLSINKILNEIHIRGMIDNVKQLCGDFLSSIIRSVIIEEYSDMNITLFYPCIDNEFVYVTDKERLIIPFDLNTYIGKEIITNSSLSTKVAEESDIVDLNLDNETLTFDSKERETYDDYTMKERINDTRNLIKMIEAKGGFVVSVNDPSLDITKEVCDLWNIPTSRDSESNLVVESSIYSDLDVKDAVRQIFLNHPPLVRMKETDYHQHENIYIKPFIGDVRQMPGIISVPMWTPDISNTSSLNPSDYPQYDEIVADPTGVFIIFEDYTVDIIYIRNDGSTEEELQMLKELVEVNWKKNKFNSRWGTLLWNEHNIMSSFYAKSVLSFDTAQEAIQFLKNY